MTPSQCKEARYLLGWSQVRLAVQIDVGAHVVSRFERMSRIPKPAARKLMDDRVAALRVALEAAGIVFTVGDAPGVRLNRVAQ